MAVHGNSKVFRHKPSIIMSDIELRKRLNEYEQNAKNNESYVEYYKRVNEK